MPTKQLITVSYPGKASHTCMANSINQACRKAFKIWIAADQWIYKDRLDEGWHPKEAKKGLMLKQPRTTPEGGFDKVSVILPGVKFSNIDIAAENVKKYYGKPAYNPAPDNRIRGSHSSSSVEASI